MNWFGRIYVFLYGLWLQAFGLAVLMAKAGLPVPAAAPVRLAPFSAVLADIGDEQSLAANLSTFSGHLRRIQARARTLPPSHAELTVCAHAMHAIGRQVVS
jgi:hypothetical protein